MKSKALLTDKECKAATCPEGKTRGRFNDGGGLYLEVAPAGSKRWFWKFFPDGKESRLAIGSYPATKLAAARAIRDKAREQRKTGANPVQERRAAKAEKMVTSATTYEAVAREFHETKAKGWSATHARQWMRCQEKDIFPWLGGLSLATITAPVLLQAIRRVEARGALQMARDLREYAGQVFRHGIATGACTGNVATDLIGALKTHTVKHAGAVLEPTQAGELLRAIDAYKGHPVTRAALMLSALVFQRPGNLRAMEWANVDLDHADGPLWTIPSSMMKRGVAGKLNGRPHLVPLAPQAATILRDLRALTGHGRYVFPSLLSGDRPMSENTIRTALRRMGFTNDEMTAQGFRAMARTIMHERLNVNVEVIEAQLAHVKAGALGSAYDRTEFVEQRRQMMTKWADYLDVLMIGALIVPFRAKKAQPAAA